MPRTSCRDPPSTSHAPRKTSPASVATGTETERASVTRARRTSRRSARGRSGARSPPRADPSRARRSTSARAPGGTTSGGSGARRIAGLREHDEAAAAGVASREQFQSARDIVGLFDEDVLQQVAEQRVHRALVGPLDDRGGRRRRRGGERWRCPRRAGTAPRRRTSRGWPRALRAIAAALPSRRDRARARRASGSDGRARLAGGSERVRPRRARSSRSRARRCTSASACVRERCSSRARSASARELARLDLEPLALGRHAIAHRRRVVARLAERREGARRGEDRRARRVRFLLDGLRRRASGPPVVGLGRLDAPARASSSAACDASAPPRAARRAPVAPARGGPRDRAASAAKAARPAAPGPRSAGGRTGSAAASGRSRARARAPLRARRSRRPPLRSSPSRTALERRPRARPRAPPPPLRAHGRRPAAPRPPRCRARAPRSAARTAPAPSAAAPRAAACSAAPAPPGASSAPRCFSTSKMMSSMRVRFCCAASSFSSAARRRDLYFVTPAASSISVRRSAGRDDRIWPILPCSITA